MTDAFTAASPTYRAAKATDQSRGRGWNFAPVTPVRPTLTVRYLGGLGALLAFTCALFMLAAHFGKSV